MRIFQTSAIVSILLLIAPCLAYSGKKLVRNSRAANVSHNLGDQELGIDGDINPRNRVEICPESDDKLSLLFLIHRHGDRSPYVFGPKDPYKDDAENIWKSGLGMLTNKGKKRMFNLGQYLRRRYSNFLTEDPREIYSRSSDSDRCITSAQLVLAGLYKPDGNWIWNEDISWQPVPVHTSPQYNDAMLNPMSYCPTRQEESDRIFHSDANSKEIYESEYGIFIKEKLMTEYGYNFNTTLDFYDAFTTLTIEKESNLPLPSWLLENFHKLAKVAYDTELLWTHTDVLKKLYAGVIIEDIVNKMKQKKLTDGMTSLDIGTKRKQPKKTKLYHYSTHDGNIQTILDTLGVWRNQVNELPRFGSTILLEYYRNKAQSDYFVRLLYLAEIKDEDKGLKELRLTDCVKYGQTVCNLDTFDKFTKKYQLNAKDWLKECNRS